MQILKKIGFSIVGILLLIVIAYFLGPKYPFSDFDASPITLSYDIGVLDQLIADRESQYQIKPNNESRIVWNEGIQKTSYGILYLHGWSASQGEADPMHRQLAERYGCNLTLARLPGHGLVGDELLLNTTADEVIQYTKEIINIASQTCDSLIVFSCSTGSTLSAYLSSEDDRIVAQMMTSPNFGILDPKFDLLDGPWGLRLARLAVGSKYNIWEPPTEEVRDYWYTKYRIEGLVVCDQIVSNTMTDQVFAKINTPVYIGYNYTDEEHKDKVINVDLIQPFAQAISTPDSLVVTEAFTVCKHHVMTNPSHCKDHGIIRQGIEHYIENTLKINPKLQIN